MTKHIAGFGQGRRNVLISGAAVAAAIRSAAQPPSRRQAHEQQHLHDQGRARSSTTRNWGRGTADRFFTTAGRLSSDDWERADDVLHSRKATASSRTTGAVTGAPRRTATGKRDGHLRRPTLRSSPRISICATPSMSAHSTRGRRKSRALRRAAMAKGRVAKAVLIGAGTRRSC